MTTSYDDTHPTVMDKVRALIPDVTTGKWLLTNEQIELAITLHGETADLRLLVAECCDIIAGKLGRYAQSKSITVSGGVSISTDRAADFFEKKAARLRKEVKEGGTFLSVDSFDFYKDDYGNDLSEYVGETYNG